MVCGLQLEALVSSQEAKNEQAANAANPETNSVIVASIPWILPADPNLYLNNVRARLIFLYKCHEVSAF